MRVSPREVPMFGLRKLGGVLTIMLATTTPVFAQQPAPAGHIKIVSGSAMIVRNNATVAAKPGQVVFANDALRTGGDRSVGVPPTDDPRLPPGPNTEARPAPYLHAPAGRGFG